MSLEINLGKRGNILDAGAQNAAQVCIVIFWSSLYIGVMCVMLWFIAPGY